MRVPSLAVLVAVAALALAGCLRVPPTDGSDPVDAFRYEVAGCDLFETVVPGDMHATRAALPPGFEPVDYGTYWGGPAIDRSAISVVWWDCATYRSPGNASTHREVYLGAYVEVPTELSTEASPFFLFDVVSDNDAYTDGLASVGWQARIPDSFALDDGAANRTLAEVTTDDAGLAGEGTFAAGDLRTGQFAFANYHPVADGFALQHLEFEDFRYRTAPVQLAVRDLQPLRDLVGDGTTSGMGYRGWGVAYEASVQVVR